MFNAKNSLETITQPIRSDLASFDRDNSTLRRLNSRNLEDLKSLPLSPHLPSRTSVTEHTLKNAAELLVQCLVKEGVRHVFGQFGEDASLIGQALHQSKIQFIPTRHSRGAVSMAHVYSRLTGRTGVCFARNIQAILDLLPGAINANLHNAPLIVITEQAIADDLAIKPREELDLVDLFRSGLKWSQQIDYPARTADIVAQAFYQAQTETLEGQPGATYVNLPTTTALQSTSDGPIHRNGNGIPCPSSESLERAAALIRQASVPMLLFGKGATLPQMRDTLIDFATQLAIPVAHTLVAKGMMPDSHPLSVGSVDSLWGCDCTRFSQVDLIIAIGCRAIDGLPQSWSTDDTIPVLHISDTAALNNHYHPQLELVGELPTLLPSLAKQLKRLSRKTSPLLKLPSSAKRLAEQDFKELPIPFQSSALIRALRTVLKPDDILLSDTGLHREWIIRDYPCELPNTCLLFHESSSAGLPLSGAIAAKLVHPENCIITVTSVDGFLKHYPELESARWLQTPFVTLICNPGGWYPDFVEIARSMGFKGYRVTSADGLIPTLKTAISQSVPAVIDCPVDYREHID
ncbi:MAG: thiamine pyrophosphate-binding protein [Cyanobacteria bacterium P01_D01_bin.56]